MKVPVTWSMCGFVEIDADTMEEAMEKFNKNSDYIKLPTDGEYVDGSFELSSDDAEEMEAMAGISSHSTIEQQEILLYDINWDITDAEREDEEEVTVESLGLPKKVKTVRSDLVDEDILNEIYDNDINEYIKEEGADWLSDKYGWCVNSFHYMIIREHT